MEKKPKDIACRWKCEYCEYSTDSWHEFDDHECEEES